MHIRTNDEAEATVTKIGLLAAMSNKIAYADRIGADKIGIVFPTREDGKIDIAKLSEANIVISPVAMKGKTVEGLEGAVLVDKILWGNDGTVAIVFDADLGSHLVMITTLLRQALEAPTLAVGETTKLEAFFARKGVRVAGLCTKMGDVIAIAPPDLGAGEPVTTLDLHLGHLPEAIAVYEGSEDQEGMVLIDRDAGNPRIDWATTDGLGHESPADVLTIDRKGKKLRFVIADGCLYMNERKLRQPEGFIASRFVMHTGLVDMIFVHNNRGQVAIVTITGEHTASVALEVTDGVIDVEFESVQMLGGPAIELDGKPGILAVGETTEGAAVFQKPVTLQLVA